MPCFVWLVAQVLEIRRGSQIYQKLWHDGLDNIFDFKAAWKARKAQETAERAVQARLQMMQERVQNEKIAMIQAHMDDAGSDDSNAEKLDGNDCGARDERDKEFMEDEHVPWDEHSVSGAHSLRISTCCAMKSWYKLSTRIIRKANEPPKENASPQQGPSKQYHTPHWAKNTPQPVKMPGRRTVTADHQDLRRAYEKIDVLCKERIAVARNQREICSQRCNFSLSSPPNHLIERSSYWNELTLQESLDLLQCADIVLEDTITDPALADLSSREPQPLENQAQRRVMPVPLVSKTSAKNLFLESDYIEEVLLRELSIKNALEVIIVLHEHILWKLPAVTQKTSKYVADKEKQKRLQQLLRRKTLEEQIASGDFSPERQTADTRSRRAPPTVCIPDGDSTAPTTVKSPQNSRSISSQERPVLFSDTIEQAQDSGFLKEEIDRDSDPKSEVNGSTDSKSPLRRNNAPDTHAINDLIHRALHCRSDVDEAVKIANEIDHVLNEFAIRTASALAARLMRNSALDTGLATQSFRQNPPLNAQTSAGSVVHVMDEKARAEFTELTRMREAKISLRLRFPELPLTCLNKDAFELNENTLIAALVTYSDVLRCRALSVLRRLSALRSRMKLQTELNASESSAEDCQLIPEVDGMPSRHPSLERRTMLLARESATLQELEDFAVDSFRKTEVALQLKTIEHEIVSKHWPKGQGVPVVQPLHTQASATTASYLDRILDTFTMTWWSKRRSINRDSLRLHQSVLDYLFSTIPSHPSSVSVKKCAAGRRRTFQSITDEERMLAAGSVAFASSSLGVTGADASTESRVRELVHVSNDASGQGEGQETARKRDVVDQKILDDEKRIPVGANHQNRQGLKSVLPTSYASLGTCSNSACSINREIDEKSWQQSSRGSMRLSSSRARFNVQEKEEEGQMQHDLRWAQVTQKALTALGCLAVVLGEQKNLEQTDIRTLVASLEGMLKSTLQAETQLVMAEGKANEKGGNEAHADKADNSAHALRPSNCQITNFMIVYIRVYCIVNHIIKDTAQAPRLRVCGFVDVALLLLRRRNITWGLTEEIIVFLCGMTRVHGSRLLGGAPSCLLDHLHCHDVALNDDICYADDDYKDMSKEAVPIIVQAIRIFGIVQGQHKKHGSDAAIMRMAPTGPHHDDMSKRVPSAVQPEVEVKTMSLRTVGEGFRLLTLLAAGEADVVTNMIEHDVLALLILAMRANMMRVQLLLVASTLCLDLVRADSRAMEACLRLHYHLLLVDLLAVHPENKLVIHASLSGLKVLFFHSLFLGVCAFLLMYIVYAHTHTSSHEHTHTHTHTKTHNQVLVFKAPHVRKDLKGPETIQRLVQVLHAFRDDPQVFDPHAQRSESRTH